MDEHEEARKIDLHDAKLCLQYNSYLRDLNLLIVELQAQVVGPQQLHVVMAAKDAQGNETVIDLAYHGSFTVWWIDWSPDLKAYEEDDDFEWEVPPLSARSDLIPKEVVASWKDESDANDHPL